MLGFLATAAQAFYTHDRGWGFLLVGVVCGSMVLWCCYVAWTNFGPPAKRRAEQDDQS
jgi:hypothetical protein